MSKKDDSAEKLVAYIVIGTVLLPFVLIYFIIKAITTIAKSGGRSSGRDNRYRLIISDNDSQLLSKIDSMEGHEFERFMTEVLKKNNFKNVYTTRGSGDFGADIIGELNGIRYAFQCKRFESKIGPKPIGEVLRGMNHYKCQKGAVITNNYFTKQAHQESSINNIELWDRNKVLELCRYKRKADEQEYKTLTNNLNNNINKPKAGIDKTALAISLSVCAFCIVFVIGIALTGDYVRANNNIVNVSNNAMENTATESVNENSNEESSNENANKNNEKEQQTISYNNFCNEIRNYVNTTVNNELFDVEVSSSSLDNSPAITYYIKDKSLSKEEYDKLFKEEITKLYNTIKDKELIWNTISGKKDCKNAKISFSISYKNDRNVYSDSIGVEAIKYSDDKWQKSYEEIMQKDVISNDKYKTMIKRQAK